MAAVVASHAFVDTGSPHHLAYLAAGGGLGEVPVGDWGAALRRAGVHGDAGANVNFVAFASPYLRGQGAVSLGIDGQVIALFVILLAAAEAAVALAITLHFYNNHSTVDVDRADDLKG